MQRSHYSGPLLTPVVHWFDKPREAPPHCRSSGNDACAAICSPLLGELASIHESAHAVAAYVLHKPIHSVAIAGGNCSGGEFRGHPPPGRPIDDAAALKAIVSGLEPSVAARSLWRDNLIALAAGRAAQRRYGATHAVYDAMCGSDFEKIKRVARAVTTSSTEAAEYVAEIVAEAARLIDAHWPQIERMARALRAAGRLDEATISATIRARPSRSPIRR